MAGGADAVHGFGRAEMFKEPLAGTAKTTFQRHICVAWGRAEEWPAEVPQGFPDGSVPKLIDAAAKGKKNKVTFIEASGQVKEGDVLVFPDYLRLSIKGAESPGLAALKALLSSPPGTGGFPADVEDLAGSYVFVCAHAARDERCGHCGPPLVDAFQSAGAAKGKGVQVLKCSHVGGHVYAGNVITYAGKGCPDGNDGHWYGYVTPEAASSILSGGQARGPLWRGRMGLDEAGAKRERQTQRLKNAAPALVLVAAAAVVAAAFALRRGRRER